MIKVFLREKKITKGRKSLYLDFYPPVMNYETNKQTRRQHLRIFIYEKPRDEIQRDHNKRTKMLGERLRSEKQIEVQEESFGFVSIKNKQKSFIKFFEQVTDNKRKLSKSSFDNWNCVLNYLKEFTGEECRFADLTPQFCEKFKEFLLDSKRLSQNTASNYFDKFKVAVRSAFENNMMSVNTASGLKSIKMLDTQREFLTLEELQKLAKTPFERDELRRAALFAALTGLRYCDIEKLIWSEIQHSDENGYYIRFKQRKTKGAETLPINDEAFAMLGERKYNSSRVFPTIKYWHCGYLKEWIEDAGITKKITFHCFRHTFATLQMTLGTDLYTVSKLLGHKNIQTTQIYAKIIDEKKREAVNKITLA